MNPKITCLHCGFLAIQEAEVSPANRILLTAKTAGLPTRAPQCFRKQWVNYDLNGCEGYSEELWDELAKSREKECAYFLWHIPGLTPTQHIDRWIAEDRRAKVKGKKRSRGRPKSEETKKRRIYLRQTMKSPLDLSDEKKRKTLFAALEHAFIPIPGNSNNSPAWLELLNDPARVKELESVLKVLRMDFER
jgi:hypothetical protein